MKHIVYILTIMMLASACGNRNSGNNELNAANADEWLGSYTFSEHIPPNVDAVYHLTVYKKQEEYYAMVVIDGYQIMTRLRAKLKVEDATASLIFDKYLPENRFTPYNEGDILLILERKDEKILTAWGKINPIDDKNKQNGKIFFMPSSEPVYDAGWCELEDVTIPQINTSIISGESAKQYNHELRHLYNTLKDDFDQFDFSLGGGGTTSFYEYMVTGDILSIIVTYDFASYAPENYRRKTYHLNIKTGQPVSSDEVIAIAGLTPEDIETAIKAANNHAVINSANYDRYKTYYTEGVIEYKDANHYRNLDLYLGKEGLVIYVWVRNLPFGEGEYFMPFLPTQWRDAKVPADITMDKAVDILSKKLNDRTMKFLLGEESESETINGEKTHYIRAYHESLDGETIGTFGHFHIGRQSGTIYIFDLIGDDGTIPYDEYLRKYK